MRLEELRHQLEKQATEMEGLRTEKKKMEGQANLVTKKFKQDGDRWIDKIIDVAQKSPSKSATFECG